MKFPVVPVLCLILFAARAPAQEAQGVTFIDCGGEKVAVFADTGSKDGNYALGWTIRPEHGKPPVDWSTYNSEVPFDWISVYLEDPYDTTVGDYRLIDGLVDLHARKFTPLPSRHPYFPHKNHGELELVWSDKPQHGTCYAVINNDGRFDTANLWLVGIDAVGAHVSDLVASMGKAVDNFLRKHEPKKHDLYGISLEPKRNAGGDIADGRIFKDGSVKIWWEAAIPKAAEANYYQGEMTIALPRGTILGVTGK